MSNTTDTSIHSYSRHVAKDHGDTAALLLGYIGHKIAHSQQVHNNRTWYFETLDDLAKRYPYLSRSAIHNTLEQLTTDNGPLITGNYNKRGYDRTTWYAFRNRDIERQLQLNPVYFKVADAVEYGLVEAILLNNLRHWILKHRETDPSYHRHKLSPQALAKHLPYTKSTIQRALKRLTETDPKVLLVYPASTGRGALEYSFADKGQLTDDSDAKISTCPNPDVSSSNLDRSNANPDMSSPILDMSGSNPDMSGSKLDMTGANLDNNTILIETCLKASHLKEGSLKEGSFKDASVPFRHTLSSEPKSNEVIAATSDEMAKPFQEHLGNSIAVVKTSAPKPEAMVGMATKCAPASVASSPANLPCLLSAPAPKVYQPTVRPPSPAVQFLDDEVHPRNWELCKELSPINDEHDVRLGIAQSAVTALRELIRTTPPEHLQYFIDLRNMKAMDSALSNWATGYCESYYDRHYNEPACPENAELRQKYIHYCQRFLSMGFHNYMFTSNPVYIGKPYYYEISLEMFRVLRPWLEQRQKQRQQQTILLRQAQYQSPDRDKEHLTTLSAGQKMQVFMQSLMSRNKVGMYDERNHFIQPVVNYTQTTMPLAREFFQLNPDLSVAHLNTVLERCLELPTEYYDGDSDPQWHSRNGRNISLFVRNFHIIATQLNLLDQLPNIVPLPPKEEPALEEA